MAMLPDAGVSAAIVVGGVALLTNWRTQRAAAAVIQAAQSGPIADRWVSAVRMLAAGGATDPSGVESRLGAIYLIEQIAQESPGFKVPALELLAAYVREHSQVGRTGLEPTTDVQAVLTVLGRSGRPGLDLRRAALWGADLEGVELVEVNLNQARLRGARMGGARLPRARLRDADLVGADLSGAVLRGAYLDGADLSGAVLRGADLQGANLSGACLRGADLREASLVGGTLADADLTGAALDGVDLTGANPKPPAVKCDHTWFSLLLRPASASPAIR